MSKETAETRIADPAADQAVSPWLGRVIGERYRVLDKLGEGGMGAVFLAEHLLLRKQVALKTIHAALEGHGEIAARFAREAMVSARIEHPNVVSALDYGTLEGGGAYLVMQLVRGESLRARMEREGALPWRFVCELMKQLADAVVAAHAAGIVHRDLKPENVVLEPGEGDALQVKVLDFGIAHLRSDATLAGTTGSTVPLTQLGVVIGTPGYMPPEQAVGQKVDERADVYAMGVMLWEMVAGFRPFEGSTLTEIVTQQFASKPPALPASAQRVPAELSVLIGQMLAASAEHRPDSAVDVRDRLQSLLATSAARTELLDGSTRRAVARSVPTVWLAVTVCAVVAALLAFRLLSSNAPSAPLPPTVTAVETAGESVKPASAPVRDEVRSGVREAEREPKRAPRARSRDARDSQQEPAVERGKESVKAAASRVRDGVRRLFR